MSTCRSCDGTILWAKTTNGKAMPVDADDSAGWAQPIIDPDGKLRPTGETATGGAPIAPQLGEDDSRRWRAHWATCPAAKDWKRR